MNIKKRKGNILITFILITVLAVVAFSQFFILSGRLKSVTGQADYLKALYVAEAGMNKAIWNLSTNPENGGLGNNWRTSGITEQFGDGQYTMIVVDSAISEEIIILSTGEVAGIKRTIQIELLNKGLPSAFDYAIYTNSNLSVSGAVKISGDMYTNGDTSLTGAIKVTDGKIYHPDGTDVNGSGACEYEDGGTPDPLPPMPELDTSFYSSQISVAEGYPEADLNYSSSGNIYLNGQTIYVNGNINISGAGNIIGPGTLVATGNINISGSRNSNGSDIKFISKDDFNISGATSMPNATFFSKEEIKISGAGRFQTGSVIAENGVTISGAITLQGLVYTEGELKFSGSIAIEGTAVAAQTSGLSGAIRLTYDPDSIPTTAPPGLSGKELKIKKGSWKEK